MFVSKSCCDTSTRSSFNETFHDKEWFINLLHRTRILTDSSSNGGDADRSAMELINDCKQNLVVYLIQTIFIYVQRLQ